MFEPGVVSEWTCAPPNVDVRRLLRVHKYKDMNKIRPVILKAAEKSVEMARKVSAPRAYVTSASICTIDERGLLLTNDVRLNCAAFSVKLASCRTLLAFVVTLGEGLDEAVTDGFADGSDPLGPLFLDTAGWLMIEAVTREFSEQQKQHYREQGYQFSTRMAPGYDYPLSGRSDRAIWDLHEQSKLFALFKSKRLPVVLLESGAMMPRMSRSGIFGIREADQSK